MIAVLAAIACGWLLSRHLLYPALGVPDHAPMILRPILGFVCAWVLLHRAGQRWSDLGLRRPRRLLLAALATLLLWGAVQLAATRLVPWLATLFPVSAGPVFLAYIRGNATALLGWLAIAWLVGGLAEELLFRAFLIDRIETALGGGAIARSAAVVAQAGLFGALHLHQGSFGFVFAGALALLYGIAYLAFARNLWPLIVVHGAWNSVAIVRLYAA